jgi:hypothetical protein
LVQVDWEKSTPDKVVIKRNPHSDIIDAVIYAFRHSPFWTYEEEKVPNRLGSREHEEEMLAKHFEALKKREDAKKGQERDWVLDGNGVPNWNKW